MPRKHPSPRSPLPSQPAEAVSLHLSMASYSPRENRGRAAGAGVWQAQEHHLLERRKCFALLLAVALPSKLCQTLSSWGEEFLHGHDLALPACSSAKSCSQNLKGPMQIPVQTVL